MNNNMKALYIHIPFCCRKCSYCSFVSYPFREADIPAYIEVLKQEMVAHADGSEVGTIFFGGGTPSLLSDLQVADIFSTIRRLFTVNQDAEITMEVNPGTVDENYLTHLRDIGINRLSIGVQSLDNHELKLLGRIHTADEAREAVHWARHAGFTNLNLDLIYGIPGQSTDSWRKSLAGAIELDCDHVSLYGLTLEDSVPLFNTIKRGDLPQIDPDRAADMYEMAEDMLAPQGFNHYEISNWARPGLECRHNLVYWHNLPYIGFGVAAHSSINGRRFANTSNLETYLTGFVDGKLPQFDIDEEISPGLRLAESVILGLRLSQGVSLAEMRKKQGEDWLRNYKAQIDELTGLGLLESNNERIRLTRRGRLLGNEVFYRFLPA